MDAQGACLAGELILWDLEALKELRRWSGHSGWVTAVAFSLDGQTLISGAADGSLILWDVNGVQLRQFEGSYQQHHRTGNRARHWFSSLGFR